MDTLALLCNLHADGPATLQRLRRAGCETLAALRRLDAGQLAQELDWNERAAERFLREAALLCERLEEDETGAEELEDPEFELESELVAELDGEDDEGESEGEAEEEEESEPELEEAGYAPPVERVEAVLGAWRELDRVAPPEGPGEFVIPRPAPPPDRSLAEVELEGLTPRMVARLRELGVHTVRELLAARELELSRALPLGFTRLKHLQFLAAREREQLASRLAEPVKPRPYAVFESVTPPPVEPFETAGPFA